MVKNSLFNAVRNCFNVQLEDVFIVTSALPIILFFPLQRRDKKYTQRFSNFSQRKLIEMEATDVTMTIYIPRMYGIDYVFGGMFDKKIVKQCEKKIKEMEKEIKKHNQIYKKLQDQQKVCWLANRKVTYKMDTSMKINDYIEENFSAHEERSTRRAMNKVQKHLQETLKQAKKTEQKYQHLLEQESRIRSSVKKLEQDIVKMIEFYVNVRTRTAAPVNSKIHTIIPIQTVVQRMSSKYQFTVPQEFNKKNGFSARLPDFELIKREFRK
ncbi:Hypothetical predicted protein [Mytilus galloprovincialis]|uniref:Uncharacterized protein n=1 Tax=Mytilus galloprovincialis TaxID=29158 RepID=A0A8B6DVI1_MYTGA|nr:Hypothetical predicted protein [Mytilus galloprovincialis]